MAKVLEYSYRPMNIEFAVAWSRFAMDTGAYLYAMVNAIRARATCANLMYPVGRELFVRKYSQNFIHAIEENCRQ